jgi:hypothetical protein
MLINKKYNLNVYTLYQMTITYDESLGSIMLEEQLCAEIKKSVTESFTTLGKVRGNVFLIRSIYRAIKQKERELSRNLDQKTMCVDIYASIFTGCTPEEKKMLSQIIDFLEETDRPLIEVVGVMKRAANVLRRCFRE